MYIFIRRQEMSANSKRPYTTVSVWVLRNSDLRDRSEFSLQRTFRVRLQRLLSQFLFRIVSFCFFFSISLHWDSRSGTKFKNETEPQLGPRQIRRVTRIRSVAIATRRARLLNKSAALFLRGRGQSTGKGDLHNVIQRRVQTVKLQCYFRVRREFFFLRLYGFHFVHSRTRSRAATVGSLTVVTATVYAHRTRRVFPIVLK